MTVWLEVGAGVFVKHYAFLDQGIGVVVGPAGVLLVDTRASRAQAEELRRDLRALTPLPVTTVVNTHGHSDHAFGNAVFRPAPIWAHRGCPGMLARTEAAQRAWLQATFPHLATELAATPFDPPDRLFDDRASVDAGGRTVELRHLGRGHTDHDIVVIVPDARVVLAGDLVESSGPPAFEDAFPLDWPATIRALAGLMAPDPSSWAVVPGHGGPAGSAFVLEQADLLEAVASLARRVHAGETLPETAVQAAPLPRETARIALDRALRQLRGELD